MNEPAKNGPSTPAPPFDTEASPAASVAPEAEAAIPEIHDPDTGSTPETIAVGPVDATFAAADDDFATAPDQSAGVIEPTVGEVGTDFSAPEGENEVEGDTTPPAPAL
ncbi:MAG: hypothetical protein GXP37_14110, partial [Chloroflexi bacterium]|nr:hypothetical protein [Chloroflexota bacterium]